MRTVWIAAALALAACGGPAVKESFYVLSAAQAPAAAAATGAATVFVGPVIVPESVDRLPMVIRTSPHQVEIADLHRWAEPLKAAIPRVVAENLMRELGTSRVSWSRLASGQPADFRVAIDVQRFDSSLEEGAAIEALWTVTPARGSPRTGRSSLREAPPSRDPAGVAAAHSRALEKLAKEIAAAMR